MDFDKIRQETAEAIIDMADLAAGYLEEGESTKAAAVYEYLYKVTYALSTAITAEFINELKDEYMSGDATKQARHSLGLEDNEVSIDDLGGDELPGGQYL